MSDEDLLRKRCENVEVKGSGKDGRGKVYVEAHGCTVDPNRPEEKVDLRMFLDVEVTPSKKK